MHARSRNALTLLIVIATCGPALYLLALATRGVSILYLDYTRLVTVLAILSVSAGAAGYLAFRRGSAALSLFGALALVANLGGLGYSWFAWSDEVGRARADMLMQPMDPQQVGIVLAPPDDSAASSAELRALEGAIGEILARNDLDGLVTTRRSYALDSHQRAVEMAARLGAHVIVWQEPPSGAPATTRRHVTVLGAHEGLLEMEPLALLTLMATQEHLVVPGPAQSSVGGVAADVTEVIAPVAAGFGALAAGQPVVAATQFRNAAEAATAAGLTRETIAALTAYRGTALLMADRADLALQEYQASRDRAPSAYAWAGTGIALVAGREWEAGRQAFQEAVGQDPYYAPPYCGLGLVLARERDVQGAIAVYRQAVALAPDWGAPHALLGLAYELLGQAEMAQEEYDLAVAKAGPNGALQLVASRRAGEVAANPPTPIATATPRPTATPTPIPSTGVYQVRPGDTLAAIAERFDVPLDRLIEVNQLADPNALSVGQVLVIPEVP